MTQRQVERLLKPLGRVRRRKRARGGFSCEILDGKMKLVRTRGRRGRK